jgi:hypothetical protein
VAPQLAKRTSHNPIRWRYSEADAQLRIIRGKRNRDRLEFNTAERCDRLSLQLDGTIRSGGELDRTQMTARRVACRARHPLQLERLTLRIITIVIIPSTPLGARDPVTHAAALHIETHRETHRRRRRSGSEEPRRPR